MNVLHGAGMHELGGMQDCIPPSVEMPTPSLGVMLMQFCVEIVAILCGNHLLHVSGEMVERAVQH